MKHPKCTTLASISFGRTFVKRYICSNVYGGKTKYRRTKKWAGGTRVIDVLELSHARGRRRLEARTKSRCQVLSRHPLWP
jgi:hypothetical protein